MVIRNMGHVSKTCGWELRAFSKKQVTQAITSVSEASGRRKHVVNCY